MGLLRDVDGAGGGDHDALAQSQHIAVAIVIFMAFSFFGYGSRFVPGQRAQTTPIKTGCLSESKIAGARRGLNQGARVRVACHSLSQLMAALCCPGLEPEGGCAIVEAARISAFNQPRACYEP